MFIRAAKQKLDINLIEMRKQIVYGSEQVTDFNLSLEEIIPMF